jgi:hypothetical protein
MHRSSSQQISALVSGWTNLQELKIRRVGVIGVLSQALVHLPRLAILEVENCYDLLPPPPAAVKGFPALELLRVASCNVDVCLSFIGCMSHTPLKRCSIYLEDASITTVLNTIFGGLQEGVVHSSLVDLILSAGTKLDVGLPPITIQTLLPIFHFKFLASLYISVPSELNLDNSDIQLIASTWPRLTKLALRSTLEHKQPRVTLGCLVHFVRHCPELESLSLVLDATADIERPERGLYSTKLHTLDVGDSALRSATFVADYLLNLFPNLWDLRFSAVKGWYEVQKVIWMARLFRRTPGL